MHDSLARLLTPERAPRRWTTDLVETWIVEALITARILEVRGAWPAQLRSAWPDAPRAWTEYDSKNPPAIVLLPTSDQIDRYDRVMAWLQWVPLPDRRILVASCMRLGERRISWRRIARKDGRSVPICRTARRAALKQIRNRLRVGS